MEGGGENVLEAMIWKENVLEAMIWKEKSKLLFKNI